MSQTIFIIFNFFQSDYLLQDLKKSNLFLTTNYSQIDNILSMDKERSPFIRKNIITQDIKKAIISDLKEHQTNINKTPTDKKHLNHQNKENVSVNQNFQNKTQPYKSPKCIKNNLKQLQIRSPERPVYMPSGFRSNKANQCIIDIDREIQKANQTVVIYSGLSKDGKYQITSKAFTGKELELARLHEEKSSLKIKQKKQINLLPAKDIPKVDESKTSVKENGHIKSYAVNTHEGISRNYNQDRVSIILNINKNGVKSTFFAVYDGHGGTGCCDFLRDYLHEYIINSSSFPEDPKKAIIEGIHKAETKFIQLTKKKFMKTNQLDRSGSCGIIVMIVGKQCFVVNVGDSRAFLSKNNGKILSHLSRDHKPSDQREQKRIIEHGGKIYRTQMIRIDKLYEDRSKLNQHEFIVGPLRVFPGKLSVTRTFGDIQAKDRDFKGIPNCVCVEPQIAKFTIDKNDDFLFLGCDGIFQKMQSIEVNKLIWKTIALNKQQSIHKIVGKSIDEVLKQAMRRKSSDNLTGIMINLRDDYFTMLDQQQRSLIRDLSCRSL